MPRTRIVDISIPAVLAVLALLPLGVPALELGYLPDRAGTAASLLLALAQTLPLAVRRRMPAVALLVVGLGFAATQFLGADTGLAGLGLLMALYSAGRYARRGQALLAGAAAVAYGLLAIALAGAGSSERPIDWVTFGVVLAAPWAVGMLVRTQMDRQKEQETLAAARAVSDARSTIARDLHDVVTHHVTAMVLQAESTVFVTDDLGDDERSAALTTIGGTGRSALRELRSLLDALDPATTDEGPREPAGVDVAALVLRLRETGYPVTLEQNPTLHAGPAASLVLHDVAREALTNAMKHAPGIPARCVLRDIDGALELVVSNRLLAVPANRNAAGRGSAIMAERMREAGGTLRAGVEDGAFIVTARLPR